MSDPTSVFETNQEVTTPATPDASQPQSGNIFSDQLKTITAEDGRQKYDTVEKALEALTHSQTLIPTLQTKVGTQEQEITQLREELAKSKGAQELVDSLTNHQQAEQAGNPSETPFGEADVASLISATLDKREQVQVQATNADKVQSALVSAFGDKTMAVVQAKAKELNTTPEALGALAASSPDMVLALFNNKSTSPSVTSNSYNMGFHQTPDEPLGRPTESLLSGASLKSQIDFMKQCKAEVHKKLGIT